MCRWADANRFVGTRFGGGGDRSERDECEKERWKHDAEEHKARKERKPRALT
jgi:hypothetical protein